MVSNGEFGRSSTPKGEDCQSLCFPLQEWVIQHTTATALLTPAKAQAQNLSGNVAARVLGRSPAGSICQARSVPAVHAGVKTCVLMESAELRGHLQNRASVQAGAKGSHWVTHRVFTLLSQPTPAQAQRNSQDDLF